MFYQKNKRVAGVYVLPKRGYEFNKSETYENADEMMASSIQ